MGNLYLAWGQGNGDYSTSLSDNLLFSNMSFTVGSPSSRGTIQMGQKNGGNNNGCFGTLTAGTNSAFTAYLTSMKLGFNPASSGQGFGSVYLQSGTSVVLDVSGNVEVGSSSTGENQYRQGQLHIGNGRAVAGNLYLGYTTHNDGQTGAQPNKLGTLALYNNTIFAVASGGKAYFGGRGGNGVQDWEYNIAVANVGSGGGLDIQNSTSDGLTIKYPTILNNDGDKHRIYNQINVTLPGIDGATNGWYWGLRWVGTHAANNTQDYGGGATGLRALLDSGDQYARLRVITNGLTSAQLTSHLTRLQLLDPATYGSKTIGQLAPADFIVNDSGYTYVGVYLGLPSTDAPAIRNDPVTDVTTSSATFNGTLTSTGFPACAVCVLWGKTDGGATWNWANTNWFNGGAADPTWTNGTPFTTNIPGLDATSDYYYTYAATNATTNAVASPPKYFITGEVTMQVTDDTAQFTIPTTNTAAFAIYRPDTCTGAALTVYYSLTGTATNGTQYCGTNDLALPLYATLNAGATSAVVTVKPKIGAGGTATVTLVSSNYPVSAVSDTGTVTILAVIGVPWTGTLGTDWDNGGNWAGGLVPTPTDDVIIDGGANQPTLNLSGGTVTIKSLIIGPTTGSTLTITNGDVSTKRLVVSGDVMIYTNGTITHAAETSSSTAINSENQRLCLVVSNNLTIAAGGKIDVSGKGYAKDTGPGYGGGRVGGGYGGQGGGGTITYGSVTNPVNSGSGGGTYGGLGGSGGGTAVLAIGGDLNLYGSILANGTNEAKGGGGAGGSIKIAASRLFGTGTLSANGGDSIDQGSGGGGGRLAVVLTNASDAAFDGLSAIRAYGGPLSPDYENGAAGTVYLKGTNQTYGTLIVNNNGLTTTRTTLFQALTNQFATIITINTGRFGLGNGAQLTMNGTAWLSDTSSRIIVGLSASAQIIASTLTIPTNATLSWSGTSGFTLNSDVIVAAGGMLTHETVTSTGNEDHKLIATILGNLTIASGGKVYVTARGYTGNYGPGAGGSGRGGGGHGGEGGGSSGGTTYDSITNPTRAGSGGGNNAHGSFAYGGGVAQLTISGALTNNGSIEADGQVTSNNDGATAGGSVNIVAGSLAGGGIISANGGVAGEGSGGGGGRIAVVLTNASDAAFDGLLAIRAYGGPLIHSDYENGAAGTVYLKGTNLLYGRLIVDNNLTTTRRTLISANVSDSTVGDVIVRNNGYLRLDNQTLTVYGSWSNAVATNAVSGGTVVFAGTSPNPVTVWGGNTWSNLTIATAGKTVLFEHSRTQFVSGVPAFSNVTLQSTAASYWYLFKPGVGTQDVGVVTVQYSNAGTNTLHHTFRAAKGSTDNGNNVNWIFLKPAGSLFLFR